MRCIDRKGPHPAPHHSRPYNETSLCDTPRSHCKGGSGVERGGDPCGRPDHAPHFGRPFSHVQVFSHCAEQRCLPRSALAIRSRCGFAEMWDIVRRSPWGWVCASPHQQPHPVGLEVPLAVALRGCGDLSEVT